MRIPATAFPTICCALLVCVPTGCDDPAPKVIEKQIPPKLEAPNRDERLDAPSRERLLSEGQLERLREAEEDGASSVRDLIAFTLPAGWSEVAPAQFRDVNLRAGPAGEVECYLTYMPGGGGGAKLNVDRWRGQFGLAATTEAEFAALPRVPFLARDAVRTELAGTMTAMNQPSKADQTMLAVFAEFPAFAMSLKMVGASAAIAAEKVRFDELVASFRFRGLPDEGGSAAEPPPQAKPATPPAVSSGAFDPTKVKWATPSGWTTGTGSSMRLVTYDVAGGGQLWVTPLSGAAGGVRANLDRFRKEMGAEPLSDDEFAALPKLKILGVDSPWLDLKGSYAGMGGPTNLPAGSARMLVAVCALPDSLVTVKFVGPADVLEREHANFQAFCESLEVGK